VNQAIVKFCQSRLSPPALGEHGLIHMLSTPDYDAQVDGIIKRFNARRDVLYEALCDIPGLVCRKPTGAFYVIAKLPVDNAEAFNIKEHRAEYEIVQKGQGWDLSKINYDKLREDFRKASRCFRTRCASPMCSTASRSGTPSAFCKPRCMPTPAPACRRNKPPELSAKHRLDQRLVDLHLCGSRTLAQRFVLAGQVFVNGQKVDKPATKVSDQDAIKITALPRYVSRGGEKLEAALNVFQLDPTGKTCLDVGASTGGFTDCLLQHGAAKVYAVDVGKHQLHQKLRGDARVVVLEQLNARELSRRHVLEPIALAVVDVSFISLGKVLPPVTALLAETADLITLVKPQFEAGPERVGRGGVVKDPKVHQDVLQTVTAFAELELDLGVCAATYSPLRGPAGNIEFLVHFSNGQGGWVKPNWRALVALAHETLLKKP